MAIECDVLVVGAGPAGSSAALAAASRGARALLVEKKDRPGVEVSCAGVASVFLTPLLPLEMPNKLLLHRNEGVVFRAEDSEIKRRGGVWSSYVMDRSGLDSWLAESAVKAGAIVRFGTEITDLEFDEGFNVKTAKATGVGGEELIKPKVVIAADGARSTVSERLGLRRGDYLAGRGLVCEYIGVELDEPNYAQIFFGDYVRGGYAYIFPTSGDTANVGVGSILGDLDLERSFGEFSELRDVKGQLDKAKVSMQRSGEVPFSRPIDKVIYGNALFAGDAAGQNLKPLVEGVLPAMICGAYAGKAAAENVKSGLPLNAYEKKLGKTIGILFDATDGYVDAIVELSKSQEEQCYITLLGLCGGVLSLDDYASLKRNRRIDVMRLLDDWKASKAKRLVTSIRERMFASYLRLSMLIP